MSGRRSCLPFLRRLTIAPAERLSSRTNRRSGICASFRNWLDLARDLQHHRRVVDRLAVDHGALVQPALADQLAHEADASRAPQPIAVPVARRLGHLLRVEPVEQRLLADVELARDLEGRQVPHARRFSPSPAAGVNARARIRAPPRDMSKMTIDVVGRPFARTKSRAGNDPAARARPRPARRSALWVRGLPAFVAWQTARDHPHGLGGRPTSRVWSSSPPS